jgi:hypothetical protein
MIVGRYIYRTRPDAPAIEILNSVQMEVLKAVSVQGVVKQPGALTQQKSPLWAAEREKSYLS